MRLDRYEVNGAYRCRFPVDLNRLRRKRVAQLPLTLNTPNFSRFMPYGEVCITELSI